MCVRPTLPSPPFRGYSRRGARPNHNTPPFHESYGPSDSEEGSSEGSFDFSAIIYRTDRIFFHHDREISRPFPLRTHDPIVVYFLLLRVTATAITWNMKRVVLSLSAIVLYHGTLRSLARPTISNLFPFSSSSYKSNE